MDTNTKRVTAVVLLTRINAMDRYVNGRVPDGVTYSEAAMDRWAEELEHHRFRMTDEQESVLNDYLTIRDLA